MKSRLDAELVRRKIARSRDDARELILSGVVKVNGLPAMKVATMVDEGTSILLTENQEKYVSRGAKKLLGALNHFGIETLSGKRVLDAGASTGGFTDVVLRKGASQAFAVDVGYGQLAWSLQNHPQVTIIDRTNIKDLTIEQLHGRVDIVVADLSFISLELVLPNLVSVVEPEGEMFLMVKPQFEVGKDLLGEGGVVREPALRSLAVKKIATAAWALGWGVQGVVASSLPGPSGNVEYFLWLRADADQLRDLDLQSAILEGPE